MTIRQISPYNKIDRNTAILELWRAGQTYVAIAKAFGISRERARQIATREAHDRNTHLAGKVRLADPDAYPVRMPSGELIRPLTQAESDRLVAERGAVMAG